LLQCAILASVTITPVATDISSIGLALWASRGPLSALQSLSMFVVIRSMNPELIHWGTTSTMLGWALPLIVSARILPLIKRSDLRVIGPLWLFCLAATGCSIAASRALAVSLMKASSLAVVAAGVLVACFRLTQTDVVTLGRWLRTLALVVAALSLVSLIRPGIAYYPDTNLVQGILSHPQALGAFLAPFSAAYLSSWLFRSNRTNRPAFAVMAILISCMLLTRSRTAAIATILGTALSLMGARVSAHRSTTSDVGRLLGATFLLVVLIGCFDLVSGGIPTSISGFIFKRGEHDVTQAYAASRGQGTLSQLQNFANSPIVGNGFGVYADGLFPGGIVEFAGIPVSAPVEKGVLPTAVLEETGLIGFIFFGYMIFALIRNLWKRTELPILGMLFACLFINLGEAILLSPGNIGLHVWLLIGWCLRIGAPGSSVEERIGTTLPRPMARPKHFVNLLE
jgi:hypothetical protein